MELETKIKDSKFKRFAKKTGEVIGNLTAAAMFVGIIGYAGLTCYQTFPGSEEYATVTKRESSEIIDFDGVPMGVYRETIKIDKDKRCLEIEDFYNGPINKGDKLKYVNWDFNFRPWLCNRVDEYEILKE
jgi:hypothetical protein